MSGALLFAKGVVDAFKTHKDQERYNKMYQGYADAASYNALVLDQAANTSRASASAREAQQRRVAALQLGQMRAAIGQSGTGYGGSNADIERQSEIFAELDALNIRYEGAIEAHGYSLQAEGERRKAAFYRDQKLSASEQFLGVLGSMLGSSSNAYSYGRS